MSHITQLGEGANKVSLVKFEILDEPREPEKLLSSSLEELKVVVHLITGEIKKGYIAGVDKDHLDRFLSTLSGAANGAFQVRVQGAKEPLAIQPRDIKAIFVVKSFQGDPKRNALRFYSNGPAVGNIWVEIQFKDNEIVEGLIENSIQHLIGEGFLLVPSDLGSNNLSIYVNKGAIASYRVLGVRAPR